LPVFRPRRWLSQVKKETPSLRQVFIRSSRTSRLAAFCAHGSSGDFLLDDAGAQIIL
jgi:hypothetical protein